MKKIILLIIILPAITAVSFAQDVLFAGNGAVITVQNGATLFANGGINLQNNSSLNNAGTITIARTAATTADFTDNSSTAYNYGIGQFVFTGSGGTQSANSINQFGRIQVDNTGLNLLSNINASTWILKSGKINTSAFIAIANSTAANAVQADITNIGFANSWINGNLTRYISPATVNNYQFPVGDATKVNLAEMDNLLAIPLTGVNYITASFGPKPGNDIGLNVSELGTAYMAINNGGVWHLSPDANPASGVYDLKLFFNGFTGLADNAFGILRRPDASANAIDWIVPVGSVLPAAGTLGRTVAGTYARRNNISTFSQLGIGTSSAPLPLQLISFTATKKDKTVLLQWITNNEINTSHFELYRSEASGSMQYLGQVAAAGNSAGSNAYNYTDSKPLRGLNFYQLKMIDKNGNYKLSQVEKINFDESSALNVYPNPVTGNILFVDNGGRTIKEIKLIAIDGKQLACRFTTQSSYLLKVELPVTLAKGTYILQLNTGKELLNNKIVVQ